MMTIKKLKEKSEDKKQFFAFFKKKLKQKSSPRDAF